MDRPENKVILSFSVAKPSDVTNHARFEADVIIVVEMLTQQLVKSENKGLVKKALLRLTRLS